MLLPCQAKTLGSLSRSSLIQIELFIHKTSMSVVLSAPSSLLPAPAWELRTPTDAFGSPYPSSLRAARPQGRWRLKGLAPVPWVSGPTARLCPQKSKLGIHHGKLGPTPPPGLWESGVFGSALTGLLCSTMRESQVAVSAFSWNTKEAFPGFTESLSQVIVFLF